MEVIQPVQSADNSAFVFVHVDVEIVFPHGYGPWWLRSQTDAYFSNVADTVDDNGSLYLTWSRKIRILAFRVDQNLSVRPAIWVDIGQ